MKEWHAARVHNWNTAIKTYWDLEDPDQTALDNLNALEDDLREALSEYLAALATPFNTQE